MKYGQASYERFQKALELLNDAKVLLNSINNSRLEPAIEELSESIRNINEMPKDSIYWEDFE